MDTKKNEIQFVNGYLKELRETAVPLPEATLKEIMSVDLNEEDLTPFEIHPLFATVDTSKISLDIE